MPDPNRKTVSATEMGGLFHVSPYVTRWMLYRQFADGLDISSPEDGRMKWGKIMQPLVLQEAADELRLEVKPNDQDHYVSRGLIGCTRDAEIICPDRGPGALETKCVFDYRVWMESWLGGKAPPRQHEVQLQVQMYVGDGERPFDWGIIAAWLAGEMHYFERKPIPELWAAMEVEAANFFIDLNAGNEPDPFGAAIEVPLITKHFTPEPEKILDLEADESGEELATLVKEFEQAKAAASAGNKLASKAKAKLMAAAKDAGQIKLPHGITVKLGRQDRKGFEVKPSTSATIKTHVPEFADAWDELEKLTGAKTNEQ